MAGPKDHLEHAGGILKKVVVPEPKNRPPKTIQVSSTPSICVVGMLSAVSLDHQATFDAREVCDQAPDRLLPTKLESAELAIAEMTPKPPLPIRRLAP